MPGNYKAGPLRDISNRWLWKFLLFIDNKYDLSSCIKNINNYCNYSTKVMYAHELNRLYSLICFFHAIRSFYSLFVYSFILFFHSILSCYSFMLYSFMLFFHAILSFYSFILFFHSILSCYSFILFFIYKERIE